MSVNKSKPVYSTGVAADLSGLSPDTLRNYEKAGLIKPHRTKGGKRLYKPARSRRVRHNNTRRHHPGNLQYRQSLRLYAGAAGLG